MLIFHSGRENFWTSSVNAQSAKPDPVTSPSFPAVISSCADFAQSQSTSVPLVKVIYWPQRRLIFLEDTLSSDHSS